MVNSVYNAIPSLGSIDIFPIIGGVVYIYVECGFLRSRIVWFYKRKSDFYLRLCVEGISVMNKNW